ncbi:hypothetical protein EDB84DRAFT_728644 [Lactarius hengduanensis]|nr:hypothetical protein EDB84DRAFT_728644 [Lactarius hengduanensis]
MSFYVPSTPSRHRSRSYSLAPPPQMAATSYPYPATPYSGYNTLAPNHYDTPGYNNSQTYYVAPSISGRSRSRSRSRPAHGHGHGHTHRRSHSHHRHHGHGHQRRSHSTTSHRHQRPSHHVRFSLSRNERITYPRHSSPTIGERILNFFGLGNNHRYVDQHGRSVDNRGRTLHKY